MLNSGTNVITHGINSVYINILGTPVNNGTYDLINYGGTAGGTITSFGDFKLGTTPSSGIRAKTYTLVNNPNEIDLSVVGTDNNTTWTGLVNSNWDNTGNNNWIFNAPPNNPTQFVIGDNVTFGNGGPRGVTIADDVSPASVTFTNTAGNDLTFTANTHGAPAVDYAIANGAVLHKASGAGKVTISNNNTYTGATTINEGTISIGSDGATAGVDHAPLGLVPASATAGNVVINGGALNASASFTLHANRGVALGPPTSGTGSGTIDVDNGFELVVAGVVANNGNDIIGFGIGGLNKTGSGTLTLNSANTFSGTTTIPAGVLKLGNVNALQNSTLNYNYPAGTGGTISFSTLTTSHSISGSGGSTLVAVTMAGLTGSQDLDLQGQYVAIGNGNVNSTYSGSLTGGGSLVKVGSNNTGTFTINGGTSNYSGETWIEWGNLVVASTAQLTTYNALHLASWGTISGGTTNEANLTFMDMPRAIFRQWKSGLTPETAVMSPSKTPPV